MWISAENVTKLNPREKGNDEDHVKARERM